MGFMLRSWVAVVLLPAAAAAATGSGHDDERRTLARSFPVKAGQDLRIDLRWGELEIEPTDGANLELSLEAECEDGGDRCRKQIADLDIESDASDDRLEVEVTGLSRTGSMGGSVRLLARVPRGHALVVDMGAGEVMIEDFAADLDVDLGAGEIRVRMEEGAVRRVDLSAGVGDARLHGPDGELQSERAHLLGGSVRWDEGRGTARVDCRVGAGEVEVRLD
jgi:hypothetical protein